MTLTPPVGTIIHAGHNAAHADHLHVEPPTRRSGTPPTSNPGMTPGVVTIYDALTLRFGPGRYFLDKNGRYVGDDPGVAWTHMGGWNRRRIAGSSTWSQHAWWNALDVGPYVGLAAQKPYLDFLTGKEPPMTTHQHTPPPGKTLPTWFSQAEWNAWVAASNTNRDTAHFDFYRYDWSWIYGRVIRPMELEIERLQKRVNTLEALAPGGSTTDHIARQGVTDLRNHLRNA